MAEGNHRLTNQILRQFKDDGGKVHFPTVFQIPSEHRIAEMARNNFEEVNVLIIGALTVAFENMNLKRGMNELQILNLSEIIIDQAKEDNLALEDVMLFLQRMINGEYEMSYESMDIPKFMKMFEMYREERFQNMKKLRDDKQAQFHSEGNFGRTNEPDVLSEHFARLGDSITSLKDSLKETRKEINILKQVDKF